MKKVVVVKQNRFNYKLLVLTYFINYNYIKKIKMSRTFYMSLNNNIKYYHVLI